MARGAHLFWQIASTRTHRRIESYRRRLAHLTAEQDARLMIAAVKANVPAPRVRANPRSPRWTRDGYVRTRQPRTLATRILREDRFAPARKSMRRNAAPSCRFIASHFQMSVFSASRAPSMSPSAHDRRLSRFKLPALELGLRWAASICPKRYGHTVVHATFAPAILSSRRGIRCVSIGNRAERRPDAGLGWVCVKTGGFGGKNPVGGIGTREVFSPPMKKPVARASIPRKCASGKHTAA